MKEALSKMMTILAWGMLASACSRADGATAVRITAVCTAGTCDADLHRALADFATVGLHTPGASFEVWLATELPDEPLVTACVPLVWPSGNVTTAKGEFLRKLEEALDRVAAGERRSLSLLDGCPESTTIRRTEDLRLFGSHDRGAALAHVAAGSPGGMSHVGVICDVSENPQGTACTPARLAAAWEAWLVTDLPSPLSTFTVYRVGTDQRSASIINEIELPAFASPAAIIAYAVYQGQVLARTPLMPTATASAIAEAATWGAARALERPGRHRLIVVSDLRQYSRQTGLNFENRLPAIDEFTAVLKANGLWIDLQGTPVTACGAFLLPDAVRAQEIRYLWTNALRAMGAGSVSITEDCPLRL